ncbi:MULTISPECIES: hypothetical protein [Anaerotruncus]|uniref:hypothetical protein n=1 Tax=Anaerotruncus TaxID=244127 RepID=UPI000AAAE4EE|nr:MULTISPECIES: hypothetical protein [Anaerotruncus]RGX54860.1 hypothetical protein DWV16_11555 [Anaerotruncus sp. AF02-27]
MERDPYFRLFSRVTEVEDTLERIMQIPGIPMEAQRALGVTVEDLRDAQRESEELYINKEPEDR